MAPFRQIEGSQAGPNALGILVPPGRRTIVVIRPRSLEWDLIPLNPNENGGPRFWEVARIEAPDLAQRVYRALEQAAAAGNARVDPLPAADGRGYELRAAVGVFVLVACARAPGEPYRPQVFATVQEALDAAERLTPLLCPRPDAEQPVYFNTRNFAAQA